MFISNYAFFLFGLTCFWFAIISIFLISFSLLCLLFSLSLSLSSTSLATIYCFLFSPQILSTALVSFNLTAPFSSGVVLKKMTPAHFFERRIWWRKIYWPRDASLRLVNVWPDFSPRDVTGAVYCSIVSDSRWVIITLARWRRAKIYRVDGSWCSHSLF